LWEKRYLTWNGQNRAGNLSRRSCPLGPFCMWFAPRSNEQNVRAFEHSATRESLLDGCQNTYMNWRLDREQRAPPHTSLTPLCLPGPNKWPVCAAIVPHAKTGEKRRPLVRAYFCRDAPARPSLLQRPLSRRLDPPVYNGKHRFRSNFDGLRSIREQAPLIANEI